MVLCESFDKLCRIVYCQNNTIKDKGKRLIFKITITEYMLLVIIRTSWLNDIVLCRVNGKTGLLI